MDALRYVRAARRRLKWLSPRSAHVDNAVAPAPPRREKILGGLDLSRMVGAEIGPLHNALVSKTESPRVIYIDHCDTETLRKTWAPDPNVDVSKLHVDAVWGELTLKEAIAQYDPGVAAEGLDYVVASHVIEHVPDMITWLHEIEAILKPQRELRLAVPDRRYTFDYLRRTSDLASVLYAYLCRARVPSALCILDFTLNMAPVDCADAWHSRIDESRLTKRYDFESCIGLADDARLNGAYHDVHCWVFTPASFAELCAELSKRKLLNFRCGEFHDTSKNEFEFFVTLQRSTDEVANAKSWLDMKARCRET